MTILCHFGDLKCRRFRTHPRNNYLNFVTKDYLFCSSHRNLCTREKSKTDRATLAWKEIFRNTARQDGGLLQFS